jgi:hypothetical protein
MVSKGVKIAISLVIIGAVALVLMAWRVWRMRRVEWNKEPVPQEASIKSTCTKKSTSSSVDEDDASYKVCDFNNLEMYHSQLDVHLCKSSMCEVCTKKDPPSVSFVGSEKTTSKDLEESTAVEKAAKTAPNDEDGRMSRLSQDEPLDIAVIPTVIAGEHFSVEIG